MTFMNEQDGKALYALTIPVFVRTLKVIDKILAKAERHAKRHKVDPATFLSARLYPDMYTLLQQIQYLCFVPVDFAKNFTSATAPRVGYDEKTFADLKMSINETIGYLRSIKPQQFGVRKNTLLPLFFDDTMGLSAKDHAARLTLPDFFFHAAVAYAILRHNGVPLGKGDFLGPLGAVPITKKKKP